MHRFRFLKRRFPIVAESHLPSGLEHLGVAPGEFLFGQGNQLIGRVGNEFVLQIANQTVTAACGAGNATVVGFARWIRGGNFACVRNLQLR